jgi:two-component sensor histidine kinase
MRRTFPFAMPPRAATPSMKHVFSDGSSGASRHSPHDAALFRVLSADQDAIAAQASLQARPAPFEVKNGPPALQEWSGLPRRLHDQIRLDHVLDIRKIQARCEHLQALADRQAALLSEMNHRIANSLAIVASLVRMQANDLSDEAARAALLDTENRLAAIMHLHRSLYASAEHERTELGEYLRCLIADLERSLLPTSNGHRLRLEAIQVHVPTDRVIPLGIIVCELVTNALKHAYPIGTQAGEIRVLVRRSSDGRMLRVTVEDDGVGFAASMPARRSGIGRRVVDAMALSLGARATIDTTHRGARVIVEFPL